MATYKQDNRGQNKGLPHRHYLNFENKAGVRRNAAERTSLREIPNNTVSETQNAHSQPREAAVSVSFRGGNFNASNVAHAEEANSVVKACNV